MTKKPTLMPAVAAIQPPRSKPVTLTEQAREATHLMQQETTRLQHRYHGPEHLLYGLLRDASDPAGIDLYPNERREHAYLRLPIRGPTRAAADRGAWSRPGDAARSGAWRARPEHDPAGHSDLTP